MQLRSRLAAILCFLTAFTLCASAQSNLTLSAGPPNPVANSSATVVGNGGAATLYYWVVANYPSGSAFPFGPAIVNFAPSPLTGGNYVNVTWPLAPGATSYDVIAGTTPTFPAPCSACKVGNTASSSLHDNGGAYTSYTLATAGAANATMVIDNMSTLPPVIRVNVHNNLGAANYILGAGGPGGVTAVTASSPLVSSGGTTPNLSCPTCGGAGPPGAGAGFSYGRITLTGLTSSTPIYGVISGTQESTTESFVQQSAPSSAFVSGLYISFAGINTGNTIVWTFRDNGASTVLTCTQVAPATSCNDTVHSTSVAQGDLISIQAQLTAGTTQTSATAVTAVSVGGSTTGIGVASVAGTSPIVIGGTATNPIVTCPTCNNATTINGATVPVNLGIAGTNASGQIVNVVPIPPTKTQHLGSGLSLLSGDGAGSLGDCLNYSTFDFTVTSAGGPCSLFDGNFASLSPGTQASGAFLIGTGASLAPTGTGTINANRVNGAAVPVSASYVGTNASGQLITASTPSASLPFYNIAIMSPIVPGSWTTLGTGGTRVDGSNYINITSTTGIYNQYLVTIPVPNANFTHYIAFWTTTPYTNYSQSFATFTDGTKTEGCGMLYASGPLITGGQSSALSGNVYSAANGTITQPINSATTVNFFIVQLQRSGTTLSCAISTDGGFTFSMPEFVDTVPALTPTSIGVSVDSRTAATPTFTTLVSYQ